MRKKTDSNNQPTMLSRAGQKTETTTREGVRGEQDRDGGGRVEQHVPENILTGLYGRNTIQALLTELVHVSSVMARTKD